MQGRHIPEDVFTLHETVHEMHRKKLNGVILKIDFEKAYDKVKWSFLQQKLWMKGFLDDWRALINNLFSVWPLRSMTILADTSRRKKV
jgi:hypothetical protein